ncbi:MAG: hypothetical protein ABR961_05960 [Thermoanaerobaculaceae bacterium]
MHCDTDCCYIAADMRDDPSFVGKADGLRVVPPHRVRSFLDPLPVRRLHGVGPAERAGPVRTSPTLASHRPPWEPLPPVPPLRKFLV